jgi:hypothetical protein
MSNRGIVVPTHSSNHDWIIPDTECSGFCLQSCVLLYDIESFDDNSSSRSSIFKTIIWTMEFQIRDRFRFAWSLHLGPGENLAWTGCPVPVCVSLTFVPISLNPVAKHNHRLWFDFQNQNKTNLIYLEKLLLVRWSKWADVPGRGSASWSFQLGIYATALCFHRATLPPALYPLCCRWVVQGHRKHERQRVMVLVRDFASFSEGNKGWNFTSSFHDHFEWFVIGFALALGILCFFACRIQWRACESVFEQ